MTERELERRCMNELEIQLPHVHLWKIHTETEGGLPDLEVNWGGGTTKIEFKLLGPEESIHKKWEDPRQLVTCIKYEHATSRCWIVAFRKPHKKQQDEETLIYRPSALRFGQEPRAELSEGKVDLGRVLWERGVIRCRGFRFDVIANLIRTTHL